MSKSIDIRPLSSFFQNGGKGYRGMFLQPSSCSGRKEVGLEEAKVLAKGQIIGNNHPAARAWWLRLRKGELWMKG